MRLSERPVHLGRSATATVEPRFTADAAWYASYAQRHAADGADGRLVSSHTFSESWGAWEVHPHGAEVVLCTAGSIALIQEVDGDGDGGSDGGAGGARQKRITLAAGEFAVNPPGVWHTADVVAAPATVVFITPGVGTEHRPR